MDGQCADFNNVIYIIWLLSLNKIKLIISNYLCKMRTKHTGKLLILIVLPQHTRRRRCALVHLRNVPFILIFILF